MPSYRTKCPGCQRLDTLHVMHDKHDEYLLQIGKNPAHDTPYEYHFTECSAMSYRHRTTRCAHCGWSTRGFPDIATIVQEVPGNES